MTTTATTSTASKNPASQNSSPRNSTTTASTIAILGAGRVGGALIGKLAGSHHRLIVGVRDSEATLAKWSGPEVTFTDPAEAVRDAQIIINATPGETSLERLSALRAELDGKILIDVSNATQRSEAAPLGDLMYPDSSLAERLQEALPNTSVVKTLNTMMFMVMTNPQSLDTAPTAFSSGNDAAAKATVHALLGDLGWPDEWIMDLGDIASARGTEALFMFVPFVARSIGFVPFAISVAR